MFKKCLLTVLTLLPLLAIACKKEDLQTFECAGPTPTYTADIKAIVDANCAVSGCHNSTTKANGIDLSTYEKVKSESSKARFLGAIQRLPGYKQMPKDKAKLADANIQKISCWVQNGQVE